MKSFKQFIIENPPPADWDLSTFTKSFKKQIDYCIERAAKLGAGSSRVVFEVEFEGRPTALKVAKNAKGLAQNVVESDWSLYRSNPDIIIPLIDFDEENDPPRWIHQEKASKITGPIFKSMTGFEFEHFGKMLKAHEEDRTGRLRRQNFPMDFTKDVPQEVIDEISEDGLYYDVTDMMANYDIMADDLTRLDNWGVYKGSPVIIDMGASVSVIATHYAPKKHSW